MTYYILYNPKSRNGSHPNVLKRLRKLLKQEKTIFKNILTIENEQEALKQLHEDDVIVLVGGDGTLHQFLNRIKLDDIPCKLAMYQSGTGNDFIRSLKSNEKIPMIKPFIFHLPKVSVQNKSYVFVNGVGIGLDGYVGHIIETRQKKKSKFEFFKSTLIAIGEFKPFEIHIETNNKKIYEPKTWFVTCMYGAYFGGGMNIAPNQKRDSDTLSMITVKDCPKWLLFIIFPSIYFGKHFWFKKYVTYEKVQSVRLHATHPQMIELDGEVIRDVQTMDITR